MLLVSQSIIGSTRLTTFSYPRAFAQMTDVPLSELPQPLQNALASFVGQCGGAALRQVLVTLLMAVFEGLPDGTRLKAAVQPPKPKVGLLIVLASILRTRPEVLVVHSWDFFIT